MGLISVIIVIYDKLVMFHIAPSFLRNTFSVILWELLNIISSVLFLLLQQQLFLTTCKRPDETTTELWSTLLFEGAIAGCKRSLAVFPIDKKLHRCWPSRKMTQICELLFKLRFTEAVINHNKVEVKELKEPGSWVGFRLGDFACHQALLQVSDQWQQ